MTERVIVEHGWQQSAEMYRALAASIPGGFVLLFDTDLRFLIAEGPALVAFGFAAGDLEGRTLGEAFVPELARELEPRYLAALAGQKVEWERRIEDRTFSLIAGPVSTADCDPRWAMVIAHDVTAQRRTQATWGALHEIATSVARNAAPETIAAQVAVSLNEIFHVHTAAVVQFTGPEAGEVVAMAPVAPSIASRHLRLTSDDWSATAQVAKTGRPALVTYQAADGGLVGALRLEGIVTGAAAPIHHDGVLWGTIALGAQQADRLTPDVLDQLASFAQLIEIALTNSQALSTLTEQAEVDVLTNLPNRRSFEQRLARENERALRSRRPVSLVLIDIDHFKRVNDTFGHPAGDRALAEVAARLSSVARNSEIVARLGGEEFVWLLPDTDEAGAVVAAERARAAVADRDFDEIGHVTISLGVCCSSAIHELSRIVECADSALYEAKRGGRDRSVLYGTQHAVARAGHRHRRRDTPTRAAS